MNYNKNVIFSGACLMTVAIFSLLLFLAIASKYVPFIQDHLYMISASLYGMMLISFFGLELIDQFVSKK